LTCCEPQVEPIQENHKHGYHSNNRNKYWKNDALSQESGCHHGFQRGDWCGDSTATGSEGAIVVVNGRRADKLEKFASELPQDRVLLHIGDVSEEANAKDLN
jgi:hypothetical protein